MPSIPLPDPPDWWFDFLDGLRNVSGLTKFSLLFSILALVVSICNECAPEPAREQTPALPVAVPDGGSAADEVREPAEERTGTAEAAAPELHGRNERVALEPAGVRREVDRGALARTEDERKVHPAIAGRGEASADEEDPGPTDRECAATGVRDEEPAFDEVAAGEHPGIEQLEGDGDARSGAGDLPEERGDADRHGEAGEADGEVVDENDPGEAKRGIGDGIGIHAVESSTRGREAARKGEEIAPVAPEQLPLFDFPGSAEAKGKETTNA